ncbi:MAG: hypothetical protein KC468_37400, partial [Myxococcales bacterium]|nr:hypothetical protein [Myxococcales bacterium]
MVVLWLTILSAFAVALAVVGGPRVSGAVDGLVPVDQRLAEPELWVLLSDRPERAGDEGSASRPAGPTAEGSTVERAAIELAEQLDALRVPVAPPASDAAVWLDAHRLYLVPRSREAALAERLYGDAIRRAVAGIRARLSSPLYSVSGEEPRRDPLRLRELMDERPGQLGFMTVEGEDEEARALAPRITVAGDLIAADGRAALLRVQLPAPADEAALRSLEDRLRAGLEGHEVDFAIVGQARREASARSSIRARGPRLVWTAVALLALLLSVTLRSVRAVAGVLLCGLGGVLAATAAGRGALGLLDIPLLVLTLGFACEGALHLPRLSSRGWPAALILATALLPLALSPYPAWRAWATQWPAGVLVAALGLRLALPGLSRLSRRELALWPQPGAGFHLRPAPALALLLCAASLAGGAWSLEHVDVRGGHPLPTADAPLRSDERRLARAFFDPGLLAEVRAQGATPVEALERGAAQADELRALLETAAARVDSPALFIASEPARSARASLLEELGLEGALERLEQELAASGMRPAAFSEFLEAALATEVTPSAEAALAGPLGPWARA